MEEVTVLDADPIVHCTTIGCDIHSSNVVCCCLQRQIDGSWKQTSKTFPTDYVHLLEFAQWCIDLRPSVILMESTASYWMSAFDILQLRGLPITIVNPAHVKAMAGRKTDHCDAHWLATIALNNSFQASYVPPMEYRHLRAVERNVTKQMQVVQACKNRETKLFVTAGYRLNIFSDEFGKISMKVKDAILAGKSATEILALVKQEKGSKRLKATDDELLVAFNGNMTSHLRFAIQSNRRMYKFAVQEVATGKEYVMQEIQRLDHTSYQFLQTIPGIDRWAAAIIITEIGGCESFLHAFKKSDGFAAWLGLCPGNNSSNSKRTGKKGRHGDSYLRNVLCEVAQSAVRTKGTTFQSKFKSLVIRLGFKRSIVAIAHKIAKMVHYVLFHQRSYRDPKINYQDLACQRNRVRWIKQLLACQDLEISVKNRNTGEVIDTQTFRNTQHVERRIALQEEVARQA